MLISVGKQPPLNESFKIAIKLCKSIGRRFLKSVHGISSRTDCLFARYITILIMSSSVTLAIILMDA